MPNKSIKPLKPTEPTEQPKKEQPKPVDSREFMKNAVDKVCNELGLLMKLEGGKILNNYLQQKLHGKGYDELTVDQLKQVHRDITARIDKIKKPAVTVTSAQEKIAEFYDDKA